jgi:gliding motility-associated lipoprotein GldH
MKTLRVLFLFFVALLFSCSGNEYEKSYRLDNETWIAGELLQFNFEVEDIYARYNIYLHIRNTTEYGYSNIFLFVNVLYPDNTMATDTVEGNLTDGRGRWLGSGSGKYRNNKFVYKSNISFPLTGTYVFSVDQAMRNESLRGISSVGLEIEKINAGSL